VLLPLFPAAAAAAAAAAFYYTSVFLTTHFSLHFFASSLLQDAEPKSSMERRANATSVHQPSAI
jgi:hypothetical protein